MQSAGLLVLVYLMMTSMQVSETTGRRPPLSPKMVTDLDLLCLSAWQWVPYSLMLLSSFESLALIIMAQMSTAQMSTAVTGSRTPS